MNKLTMVTCPRCDGDGEEPGVPSSYPLSMRLCSVCHGDGEVTQERAAEYAEDEE